MSGLFGDEGARAFDALRAGEDLASFDAVGADVQALYGPLLRERWVLGQMGQSLDGFIATTSGASHYVTGPESLVHLHRLRALADAVVVGAATVRADDARLTVRHCSGDDPTRVVVDPRGDVAPDAEAFAAGADVLRIVADGAAPPPLPAHVESLALPLDANGHVPPRALLDALAERDLGRILVEGGGRLVSSFLGAGALDRLHVVVAPFFIGDGVPGVRPAPVTDLSNAPRPQGKSFPCGRDVLFDLEVEISSRTSR